MMMTKFYIYQKFQVSPMINKIKLNNNNSINKKNSIIIKIMINSEKIKLLMIHLKKEIMNNKYFKRILNKIKELILKNN